MSYGVPAPDPAEQTPVCPRHPERVSYVRCQRCARPVCPECQRPAAVGVQCIACVREQARGARGTVTPYGGSVYTGAPVVTYTMITLCAVVFALQWLVPGFTNRFAYAPVLTAMEPWRMLTSAFLHSPGFVLHIGFNMYALWILGQILEPLLGRLRFAVLYLLAAVGGSVGVALWSDPGQAVVGASGAVFGLFGALLVIQRKRRGEVRQLVVLIVVNGVLGFVVPGIAWQAHLGGLLSGAAAAAVLAYAPKGPRRSAIQWIGLSALAVALLGLSAWAILLLNP